MYTMKVDACTWALHHAAIIVNTLSMELLSVYMHSMMDLILETEPLGLLRFESAGGV